jgi:hypothetical protein
VSFEDMSVYVSRLYDGLAAGRPVGEVLFRLAELGVISGQARNAIEQLQESGSGFSEVWRVVEGELKRSSGTMEYTSKTLEGLQSTLEDTEDNLKATFSASFLEGQKEAIKAQITTLENMKPVVEGLGRAYSGFVGVAATLQVKLVAMLTSIPGVAHALEFLGRMAGVAAAGLTALATATGLARLTGMLAGLAGTASIAGRALGVFGKAAGALAAVLSRLVTGPMALITLAVTAGLVIWRQYVGRMEEAAAAVREYENATDSLVSKLQAQAAAIKTLDQLQEQYAQTLGALAQAYDDYAKASAEGDVKRANAAADRTRALVGQAGRLRAIGTEGLQVDPTVLENRLRRAAQQRDIGDARREAMRAGLNASQGGSLIESLAGEVETISGRRNAATAMNNGIAAFQRAKAAAGIDTMDASSRVSAQQGKLATAKGALGGQFESYEAYEAAVEAVKKLEAELESLKDAEAAALKAEMDLAQAYDNEIVRLQAGLSVYSRYEAAVQGVFAAKAALAEAQKAGEGEDAALDALTAQEAEVKRLQAAYDALGWSAKDAQEKQAQLVQIKEQMQRDLLNEPEQVAAEQRLAQAKKDEAEKQARLEAQRGADIASQLEMQARAFELGGNGDEARKLREAAAREAEIRGRDARVNDLKNQGFDEAEAARMADRQIMQERQGRALDQEGGLLQALMGRGQVVDNMQRIGGGGGVGGGPNIGDVVKRLDELIDAVREGRDIDIRL